MRSALLCLPALLAVVWALAPAVAPAADAAPRCTVKGTPGDDRLQGTPGKDVLCGGAGDDVLRGRGGTDLLLGGRGADDLRGGPGRDVLIGGPGTDVCVDSRVKGELRGCERPRRRMVGKRPAVVPCTPPYCRGYVVHTPDTQPPVLFMLGAYPRYVDTSEGDGTISVNVQVWDESGIAEIVVDLAGPRGHWHRQTVASEPGEPLFFSEQIAVPASTPAGTYRISGLKLTDSLGNTVSFGPNEVGQEDHQNWEVFEGPDLEPPELTGFTISPASVDTSEAAAKVTLDVSASDQLSGVQHAYANVVPPWWERPLAIFPGGYGILGPRIAGGIHDGTWRAGFPLPRYAQPGAYEISAVTVRDQAGNRRRHDTSELEEMGLPTEFEQTAVGDTTPPQILDFWIEPQTVHAQAGEQPVTFFVELSDDLSGLGESEESVFDSLRSSLAVPGDPPSIDWTGTAPAQVSGTKTHGVWSWTLNVTPEKPLGDYTTTSLTAVDRAGNATQLKGSELTGKGWDLTFTNAP